MYTQVYLYTHGYKFHSVLFLQPDLRICCFSSIYLFIVCVHVCAWYYQPVMFSMWACRCTYKCACRTMKARNQCQLSFSITLHLIFETVSLMKLKLVNWYVGWQESSRGPPTSSSIPSVLGFQGHDDMPGFVMCAGDPHSGPLAHTSLSPRLVFAEHNVLSIAHLMTVHRIPCWVCSPMAMPTWPLCNKLQLPENRESRLRNLSVIMLPCGDIYGVFS